MFWVRVFTSGKMLARAKFVITNCKIASFAKSDFKIIGMALLSNIKILSVEHLFTSYSINLILCNLHN